MSTAENRQELLHKTALISVNTKLGYHMWSCYISLKEKQMPGSLNEITTDLSWTLQFWQIISIMETGNKDAVAH